MSFNAWEVSGGVPKETWDRPERAPTVGIASCWSCSSPATNAGRRERAPPADGSRRTGAWTKTSSSRVRERAHVESIEEDEANDDLKGWLSPLTDYEGL